MLLLLVFYGGMPYGLSKEEANMISERIYTLRRKSGLSQEQLAEKIGVSRQAISKWENGSSVPDLENLIALSACFQISMDELTSDRPLASQSKVPPASTLKTHMGVTLCWLAAFGLLLFGISSILRPTAVQQLNDSSMITLNGSGILLLVCILVMACGLLLILKKK